MDSNKVIAITSPAKGTGKTTVALNLSAHLVGKGYKVCLLDLTANRCATEYHFPNSGPSASVISWLNAVKHDHVISSLVLQGLSGVHIVPGPAIPQQCKLITPKLVELILYHLTTHFDAVIIDTDKQLQNTLPKVIETITVSTPDKATLKLTKHHFPNNNKLVINKIRKFKLGQTKKIKAILGIKPICYIPVSTKLIEQAYIQRPRNFPVNIKGRTLKKQFNTINKYIQLNNHTRQRKTKSLYKFRKSSGKTIRVFTVNQVIKEAKKAPRPLVIVDCNYVNPSLAIAFDIPLDKIWAHDWRSGKTATPYQIEKNFDLYTLDPEIDDLDDRDQSLLDDLINTLSHKYKTIIMNLPDEKSKKHAISEFGHHTTSDQILNNNEKQPNKDKINIEPHKSRQSKQIIIPDHLHLAIITDAPDTIYKYATSKRKKKHKKIIIIDLDNNSNLADRFNLKASTLWQHDWRIGLSATPAKINKNVHYYGTYTDTELEERDINSLKNILRKQKDKQVILNLNPQQNILEYLPLKFKIIK